LTKTNLILCNMERNIKKVFDDNILKINLIKLNNNDNHIIKILNDINTIMDKEYKPLLELIYDMENTIIEKKKENK